MKYKVIIKQLSIIDVSAPNEEEAIKQVRNQITQQYPKELVEIDIVQEDKLKENE